MEKLRNEFDFNKVGYTVLTKGKIAYFDLSDFDIIRKHRWSCEKIGKGFYAHRKDKNNKTVRMHNDLLKAPIGFIIDHKNRDTLDNRRENLRIVHRRINALNTQRYKGYEKRKDGKYTARIRLRSLKKDYYLGTFNTEQEAKNSYNNKKQEIIQAVLG